MRNLHDFFINYNDEGYARADEVKKRMDSLRETLSADIKVQIEAELSSLRDAAMAEIEVLMESYRQSLLAEIDGPPTEEQRTAMQQRMKEYIEGLIEKQKIEMLYLRKI